MAQKICQGEHFVVEEKKASCAAKARAWAQARTTTLVEHSTHRCLVGLVLFLHLFHNFSGAAI